MAKKANIAVKLDPGIRERLHTLGQAKRRTTLADGRGHSAVRRARGKIERARAETRERLASYDATGEYIGDEDVQAWLRTWGAPNEQQPPTRVRKVRTR